MAKKEEKAEYLEELDKDSVWKELLEQYLKEFMSYFFLEASDQIDWEKGYKFKE